MLKDLRKMTEDAIVDGAFPGCNITIVKKDGSAYFESFGLKAKFPEEEQNDINTIYDMASCSKVVSTTTCMMILVDRGLVRLMEPVKNILPDFKCGDINVWDLLTHSSGLKEGLPGSHNMNREQIIEGIMNMDYAYPRHSGIHYSDVGFVTLGLIIEKITGMSQAEFAKKNIFEPLEMLDTGYNPVDAKRCATTEYREHLKAYDRGYVHDEMAHNMGGVAGHAGLFSTVKDLSHFIEMILNDGVYKGKRIVSKRTLDLFCTPQVQDKTGVEMGGYIRGLGWITSCNCTSGGDLISGNTISHTGFTGTNIVIDRENGFGYSILSNRVHPTRVNYKIMGYRARWGNRLYSELEETLEEIK